MGRRGGGDAKGKGGGKGGAKGGRGSDGRTAVRVVPATQAHCDKVLAKLVQPLSRHYNGQGCVREKSHSAPSAVECSRERPVTACVCRLAQPSVYLPLTDVAFFPTFQAVWAAHVDFGTSRSHKKLLGKKRKSESAPTDAVAMPPKLKQRKPQAPTGSELPASSAAPIESKTPRAPTAAPSSEQLANKGRWGSTMAARLLSGGT